MWSRHFSKLIRKGWGRFPSTPLEGHYYWVWREWIPQRLGKSSGMLKPPSFSTRVSKQNLPINLSTINPLEPILCWGQSIHSQKPLLKLCCTFTWNGPNTPAILLFNFLAANWVCIIGFSGYRNFNFYDLFYISFLYAKQAPFHKS